jgi:hypothetical protein
MKWLKPIKTYWELEPFEHASKDPIEFIVTYVAILFFFGMVVGMWTIEPLMFLTLIYILVELTKMILR